MSKSAQLENTANSRTRGKETREALVLAALEVFGRDGFEAASTRAIADKAGANQALINYHFKGKQGLYLAVFEYIAGRMQDGVGLIANEISEQLPQAQSYSQDKKSEFAIISMEKLTRRLLHMMNSDITKYWSNMILREQQHPTAAFDIMYQGPMGKLFSLSTHLIALAKDISPDSDKAKLLSILFFGQVHILKVSRATLLAHMQWDEFGETEMKFAEELIFQNIRSLLSISDTGNI